MDWVTLELVKGIGPYAGDTNSAEQPIDTLDLMNIEGFSVTADGWIPNFTQVKNGGLYADTDLADGRILLAAAEDNVTETMTLTATGATVQTRLILQTKLARFAQDARDFHITHAQIEPIYLKVKFAGAPGPQYALLYNIALAQRRDPFAAENLNELTITIEREPGWRALPPGRNPILWAMERNGVTPTASNVFLDDATNPTGSLVEDTINNHTDYDDAQTYRTKNFIDIPAASLPGDLPPLACLVIRDANGLTQPQRFLVGVRSKRQDLYRGVSTFKGAHNIGCNSDCIGVYSGSDTSVVADTGGTQNFAGTAQRAEISFATVATDAQRIAFGQNKSLNNYRGQYAAFLRCRQNGGSAGQIIMYLRYGTLRANARTPDILPTLQAGSGNTTTWPVTYMGQISLPVNSKASIEVRGRGLAVDDGAFVSDDLWLDLHARRTTGTGVLYVADLFLVPVDEPGIQLVYGQPADSAVLDQTGYFTHGETGVFADLLIPDIFSASAVELAGGQFELTPGVDNRIYIFELDADNTSLIDREVTVRLNVVPRWRGIRSE